MPDLRSAVERTARAARVTVGTALAVAAVVDREQLAGAEEQHAHDLLRPAVVGPLLERHDTGDGDVGCDADRHELGRCRAGGGLAAELVHLDDRHAGIDEPGRAPHATTGARCRGGREEKQGHEDAGTKTADGRPRAMVDGHDDAQHAGHGTVASPAPARTRGRGTRRRLAARRSAPDNARGMRQLIVTADDFGASDAVNDAVIDAHRRGILTTASLMVNGDAWERAVDLARTTPTLAVGLHLALSLARATLPPAAIPHLVDREGRLPTSSPSAGLRYQFSRPARRELVHEIRAQLARFAATGLRLDHVSGHQHIHMHPQILARLLQCAGEFQIPAVRVVRDDLRMNLRLDRKRLGYKLSHWCMFHWLGQHAARRARVAGLVTADRVWGLYQDGRLTREHLLALLTALPPGVTEIYAHPSTKDDVDPRRAPRAELAARVDERARALVAARGIELTSYGALASA